jgi:4-amino-4-deoxy-L-arabinose transferase-like glycosyltransferase
MLAGAAIFSVLLLLPVFMTGSWVSAQLMWHENVIRFFHPFDHNEPAYAYVKHLLLYSAPWTFLIAASLWEMRRWEAGRTTRWLTTMAGGIFLFFVLSGSRRSYYILPILPALALIGGRVLSDALEASENGGRWAIRAAALATSGLVLLSGLAMVGIYVKLADYGHISVLAVALCAIGGGCSALWLVARRSVRRGLIIALSLVFVIELWTFTAGMKLAERKRTVPGYSTELAAYLSGVEDSRIALYRESAILLFYLNKRNLLEFDSIQDLKRFEEEHPDGFLIADLNEMEAPGDIEYLSGLTILLEQKRDVNERAPRFALMRLGPKKTPSTAVVQQVPARRTTDNNDSEWGAAMAAGTPHAR